MTSRRLLHSIHTTPLPEEFLLTTQSSPALHVFLHHIQTLANHPYRPEHHTIHLFTPLQINPQFQNLLASFSEPLKNTALQAMLNKDDIQKHQTQIIERQFMKERNIKTCVKLETQEEIAKTVMKLTVKGRGIDVPQAAATKYIQDRIEYLRYFATISNEECLRYCEENNIELPKEEQSEKISLRKTKKDLNLLIDAFIDGLQAEQVHTVPTIVKTAGKLTLADQIKQSMDGTCAFCGNIKLGSDAIWRQRISIDTISTESTIAPAKEYCYGCQILQKGMGSKSLLELQPNASSAAEQHISDTWIESRLISPPVSTNGNQDVTNHLEEEGYVSRISGI